MANTIKQREQIRRQPFDMAQLADFFGTKKKAERFAINLGEALQEVGRALDRNECEDTAFELMLCSPSVLDDDDLFEHFWVVDSEDNGPVSFAELTAYDGQLDATMYLGKRTAERDDQWFIVRYEWKENAYAYFGTWV